MAATIHDSIIASSTDTTITITTFDINAACNALLVFVGYGHSSNPDPNTLTVNGVSIQANLLWSVYDGGWPVSRAYYVLNPTTGTHDIALVVSGVAQLAMAAVSLIGVDVAGTPFGTAATNSATSGTDPLVSVTSSSGLIIGFCSSDSEGQLDTDSPGVEIKKVLNVGSDTAYSAQYQTASNPTLNWTQTNNRWACGGIGVNAPAGGGVILHPASVM